MRSRPFISSLALLDGENKINSMVSAKKVLLLFRTSEFEHPKLSVHLFRTIRNHPSLIPDIRIRTFKISRLISDEPKPSLSYSEQPKVYMSCFGRPNSDRIYHAAIAIGSRRLGWKESRPIESTLWILFLFLNALLQPCLAVPSSLTSARAKQSRGTNGKQLNK